MKLFICLHCQDILKFSSTNKHRTCECGRCHGRYLKGGIDAEISGPCVCLGLGTDSLERAVKTVKQVQSWSTTFQEDNDSWLDEAMQEGSITWNARQITAFSILEERCDSIRRLSP